MSLHVEREGAGARVVLVHGFTQTRRCWGNVASPLATDHEVVRVDAPGHGRSAEVLAGPREGGRLIADAGGEATYIGYSMGARLCLELALGCPERAMGLVLLGGTAGIRDVALRAARRASDLAMAARVRDEGVERFVEAWLSQPLFCALGAEAQFRKERLENTAEGLAGSLERAGAGAQAPSWDLLHRLEMPALVMAGEDDAKFAELAAEMADRIGPNATLRLVPGAGHAAHLEQPEAFLALVRPWLARHGL